MTLLDNLSQEINKLTNVNANQSTRNKHKYHLTATLEHKTVYRNTWPFRVIDLWNKLEPETINANQRNVSNRV